MRRWTKYVALQMLPRVFFPCKVDFPPQLYAPQNPDFLRSNLTLTDVETLPAELTMYSRKWLKFPLTSRNIPQETEGSTVCRSEITVVARGSVKISGGA